MSHIGAFGLIHNRYLRIFLILGLMFLTLGCFPDEEKTVPPVVRLGVLPDQNETALQRRYAPLISHLSTELKTEIKLIVPKSYEDLLALFGAGELEIAYFGGATFVAALAQYKAVPLVMRDIDYEFSTFFVSRSESEKTKIEDFQGQRISFGSRSSTSGHFMPRAFMKENGITPEKFFSEVRYSGAHDKTVQLVLDGVVDLGAVNAEVAIAMLRDGRVKPGALKIIWETPPYSNYVWAAHPDLQENFRERLQDAFLKLSLLSENHAKILGMLGAKAFLPASRDDFSRLRKLVSGMPHFLELVGARRP